MIPLPKFRELLGPEAGAMSDKDVKEARTALHQLVEIAFDFWQREKSRDGIANLSGLC